MTKEKAPTREQRLNLNLGGTDHSTISKKHIGIKNLKAIRQQARKWAARGYYCTPSEAMKVLMDGVK